ncbi:MAG: ATP-binding protein [Bacteroidaceae bacterium]|nr:ATP-binding protein [Bacteroidaceae bacterium]
MSRIRVQNFGPIKENAQWIEVGKVTLFIGNQGSGKSTIAKLISTFAWMEKSLVRGDHDTKFFERKSKFKNTFLTYHRIQNYINAETDIEYVGTSYTFRFRNNALCVEQTQLSPATELPQIMYVPAERNFLTYIESFKELKVASPSLREFKDEYKNAQKNIRGSYELPIDGAGLEYDRQNDILHVRGRDYKLRISEASSGYQSLVPLYIVSMNLAKSILHRADNADMTEEERVRYKRLIAEIYDNKRLSEEQRRTAINALSDRFTKTHFINIVEEPEQNLFPTSQWEMLGSLLDINNMSSGNQLIMTTHSPYIINYLTVFVKAYNLCRGGVLEDVKQQINSIVPLRSVVDPETLYVYELDEVNGTYSRLETYKGMPSDENYLNNSLADSNDKFAKLLDLEDLCR